ncbi:helix-turn-helix domain-containing protein [Flavihumibacter solisilvae]|uniref:HTH araC/xylS-type domain-containing protein n=1 Tax=Flavihumibacter solisilvae TaxID=1349421 RepID=A0A0C1L6Q8_9BACT|nr:helix-turn-helix domain-containing protein [Flavihumibacter solisilvae]KIC91318.1 hypothetical protein OI18_22380 [Flavihumibacter solisilvae]
MSVQISHERIGKINLRQLAKEDHPETSLSLRAVYEAQAFLGNIRMLEFNTFADPVQLFSYELQPTVTLRKRHKVPGLKLLIMVEGSMVLQLIDTNKVSMTQGRLFLMKADDYSIVLPENSKVSYLLFRMDKLTTRMEWSQFPEGRFDLNASMHAYLHAMVQPFMCPGSPEDWLAIQLINLLSDLRINIGSGQKNGKTMFDYVLAADRVIRQHLPENLTTDQIAKLVGLYDNGLKRAFSKYYNMGMAKYQNLLRVEHATHLILHTDMSLVEIQLSCGFLTDDTFRRNFSEVTKLNPAAWRKKYKP